MYLIAGLGNPGRDYAKTRHNCGFMLVDELARRQGREVKTPECQALTMKAVIDLSQILLVKPQTYMNLSGVSVAQLMKKYQLDAASILVISDDVALPLGRIRFRPEGSAGGQNGLKSVIKEIGTQKFPRLRIGIAPDHPIKDLAGFVLADFSSGEKKLLDETITLAADAVEYYLKHGIAEAMSKYN